MKDKKRVLLIILFAAAGFICLGLAGYMLFFKSNDTLPLDSEGKNASLATIHSISYEKGLSLEISSENSKCLDYGNGCMVNLPDISAPENYQVVGWCEDKDGNGTIFDVKQEIKVSKDITLYAIIKKKDEVAKLTEVDNYCNETLKCSVGIKVVDAACSQVGYIEKETDKDLNDCTANPGINNYQKFGNNGNVWDATFVNWSFNISNVSLSSNGIEDVDDVSSYVNWARNNSRFYTNKSSLHNGDLILTNNNQHIAIAVEIENTWYMISGNSNNKVELVVADNISGFVSMRGLAY